MKDAEQIVATPAFQNFVFMAEKGGVRKTSLAALLIAMGEAQGFPMEAFEIEGRAELGLLYPDKVKQVVMPATETLHEDDNVEVRTLSPVFTSLLSPSDRLAIVDVGANLDGRLAMGMVHTGMAERLAGSGRATVFIIPFFAEAASIQSAANSGRRAELALPNAKILFCHCENGGGAASDSVKSLHDWKNVIQPLIDRHGIMRMPRLTPSVLGALRASKTSPLRFIDMTEMELARFSENDTFIAGANRNAMRLFVATMAKEFATHFGFRPA